jgi:two-component system OmpR family sensor kinase
VHGPPAPARQPRPRIQPPLWGRIPLWLRLITALLALAALALTMTGVFGVRILRAYLTDRVDDQLRAAASAVTLEDFGGRPTPNQALPSQFRLSLQDRDGATIAEVRSPFRPGEPELPSLTSSQTAAIHGDPFTVPAASGKGSWRALAVEVPAVNLCTGDNVCGTTATLLVATSMADVDATVSSLVHIDLIVGAFVLAGLAIAGYMVVRTAMRPLTEIERTAAAIAGGDLSRRIPDEDPRTEVGRLGVALNTMLNQIERAFRARADSESTARRSEEKMRRFVADASHELRTPLTSIRGFAELHRQGAVTDPGEVARLLARIEDEATRMGLLVDDLLLLARLDQQRPFEREPVDLVVVANDAVEATRARSPERDVRLVTPRGVADEPDPAAAGGLDAAAPAGEGEGPPDAGDAGDEPVGVVVAGDEPRLRQVVTNLLDNALAHTPAGTPVVVRLSRIDRDGRGLAVVEVSDAGLGLTPEQAERVFERFYRTDTARSRAQGGTGLGLSIVAAITAAHGGNVEVDSTPGVGTTFRVLLPLGR